MNQVDKVLKLANNCALFDKLKFKDANFCVKTLFLNAVLGREKQGYTQEQVANYLEVSKRTVQNLEKGKVSNIVLILNYIHFFGYAFANENKRAAAKKFAKYNEY